MNLSNLQNISFPKSNQFLLIAGPCVIEGEKMALNIAEKILGWKAKRNLEEMCKDGWNWQSKNLEGYK